MTTETIRLTTAQALVRYLSVQFSKLDGVRRRAIPGSFGIFGHGNVAGQPLTCGSALRELDNVVLTPQTAGISGTSNATMTRMATRNVLDVPAGRCPDGVINPEALRVRTAQGGALDVACSS